MINVGLVLLIIGIVIAATALIFAVRNMYKGMKAAASILERPVLFGNEKVRTSDEETTVPDVGKSSFFGRHFKAIAAMAVGGAMALVGTALIIVGIATR